MDVPRILASVVTDETSPDGEESPLPRPEFVPEEIPDTAPGVADRINEI